MLCQTLSVSCREQDLTDLCPVTCAGTRGELHLSLLAFYNAIKLTDFSFNNVN